MSEKFKNMKVTRNLLYFLSGKGKLEEDMLDKAFQESGIYPESKQMASFLDKFMLSTGVIFLVCGVVFFMAYNWADLHKFAKLGIVMASLVVSAGYTFIQDAESYQRKIGLTLLCGLTGALFAVFGQIYQTGANAYDFFFGWTIMITVWVGISRFPALWLFYVVLINVTIILYAGQVHRAWGTILVHECLFAVNALFAIAWEWAAKAKQDFYPSRLFPRIVGLAALSYLTLAVLVSIFDFHRFDTSYFPAAIAWISWITTIIFVIYSYHNRIKDLFFLAIAVLSIMMVFCSLVIEIDFGAVFSLFLISTCIVLITFFTVNYLVKLNKKWKKERLSSENN